MIRFVVLFALTALPAWAQEKPAPPAERPDAGEVLTLDEAVSLALQKNRLVQNATLDVAKSGDQIESNKAQRLPQLQLTVTPAYRLTPIDLTFSQAAFGTYPPPVGPVPAQNTTLRTDPGYTTAIQAQVSQPLSQLYKLGLGIDQAGVARDMSGQDLRAQRQSIVNSVRQSYYAVLQSQSSLEALEEQVASNRELVRVVTEQAAREAALKADLLQARASLAQAEYSVSSARHTLASQKESLNHLLGRDPATPFRVSEAPAATPFQTDLVAARKAALGQRPELQKATLQVSYAEYNVRLKDAEYIPDVSLVYKYIAPVTSDVLPKSISYVGLELSWDVFDWGRKQQDKRQRERALDQARNSVEETASQIVLDVNSSFRKLQDAQAFLAVAELNRDASREKLRTVTNQHAQQAALLKDVLAAQSSAAQAADQHRQAVLNYWEARASFEKAIGTGD
jgi:outer membrane protein TolC